jgi:hypothetical protein
VKKVKPHLRKNLLQDIKKSSVQEEQEKYHLVISFKHLDRSQGQTFNEWEQDQILSDALNTLAYYCHDTLQRQCCTDSFKPYPNFPPRDKTDFNFPNHVPPDARWASMHINGTQCLVGHVYKNTFYVVFLDKNHRFWITDP